MYRTTLPAIIPPFILVELDLVIFVPKECLIELAILDISTHFAPMSLINYESLAKPLGKKTLSVVLYNKTNNIECKSLIIVEIECKSLIIVDIKSLALVKITVMQQMLLPSLRRRTLKRSGLKEEGKLKEEVDKVEKVEEEDKKANVVKYNVVKVKGKGKAYDEMKKELTLVLDSMMKIVY